MSYKSDSNKNPTEDDADPYVDIHSNHPDDTIADLLDITDTEDSSSSSHTQVYVRNDQFVLELHELKRDELPDNPLPEVKTRKLKKKKRSQQPPDQGATSNPSSSPSESSTTPPGPGEAHGKEQFYDAHESYHALPDRLFNPLVYARLRDVDSLRDNIQIKKNQASAAVASAGIAQVLSEHGNVPKITTPQLDLVAGGQGPAAANQPVAAHESPTTIKKPVTKPD